MRNLKPQQGKEYPDSNVSDIFGDEFPCLKTCEREESQEICPCGDTVGWNPGYKHKRKTHGSFLQGHGGSL